MLIIHGEEVVQTKLRRTTQTASDCVKSTGISSCCCYTIVLNAMQYFSLQTRLRQLGGHRHARLLIRQVTLPPVDCEPHLHLLCAKWLILEMTQMISESILKHGDFMIDNRCCTKCISNKCRRGREKMSGVLSGGKKTTTKKQTKIDRLKCVVIILSSLTVTFPPDKALAFKIFIRVLTKEMTRKFLLH